MDPEGEVADDCENGAYNEEANMETHEDKGTKVHTESCKDFGSPRLIHIVDIHSLILSLLNALCTEHKVLQEVKKSP